MEKYPAYLIRKSGAKVVHIWTGMDTACHMYVTGGLRKNHYEVSNNSHGKRICHMCMMNYRKFLDQQELQKEKS